MKPIVSERQVSFIDEAIAAPVTADDLVLTANGIVGIVWQDADIGDDVSICYRCEKAWLPVFNATGANYEVGDWVYYDVGVPGRLTSLANGGVNIRCGVVLRQPANGDTHAFVHLMGDIDVAERAAAVDRALIRTEFAAEDVLIRAEFAAEDDLIMDATPRPILGVVYETSATYTIAEMNAAGPPIGQELVAGVVGDTLQVVGARIVVDGGIEAGVGDLAISATGATDVLVASNAALTDTAIIGTHGEAIADVAVTNLHTDLPIDEGIWVRRSGADFTHGTGATVSVLWKVAARA
jgi:hypothetical protein